MSNQELQPNVNLSATFKVQSTDLASAISPDTSDRFPEVFATSRLVAFMEVVCARMLAPTLSSGQLSVGVRIDVLHSAPTPVNAEVTIEATFVGKESKIFIFDVVARDVGGEVGRARHERAIVDSDRLVNGARKRIPVEAGL